MEIIVILYWRKSKKVKFFCKEVRMSKISDIIEEFILEQLDNTDYINLSRNELANFFNCAPIQINDV